jgi:hypothetical protein
MASAIWISASILIIVLSGIRPDFDEFEQDEEIKIKVHNTTPKNRINNYLRVWK